MSKFNVFNNRVVYRDLINQAFNCSEFNPNAIKEVFIHISFRSSFLNASSNVVLVSCIFIIELITGQKPKISFSKKDNSNFNIRKGDLVGIYVTLRGPRIFSFIEKYFFCVLPKVRFFGNSFSFRETPSSLVFNDISLKFFPEIENEITRFFSIFDKNINRFFNLSFVFVFHKNLFYTKKFFLQQIKYPVK
uniref:Ribosomal protein L5 n=1 Tax=Thraustochytrium aureum TaxID=42467 RepID=Q9G4D4_9STRA|nr:ribosomal protein L5 [Thraustochytrium aureum]